MRAAAVAVALAHASAASAQDTHYWSIQYGPVGQLVGGQVIGGVPDLSATFYNPGALALRNESSYLLSTESVQWELVSTQAPADISVLDTSSSRFGAAPSLLAGVLPNWLGEDTRLAWSFLTRQKFDVRLGQRLTDPVRRRGRPQRGRVLLRPARGGGLGRASRCRGRSRSRWASARPGTGSTAASGRATS